MNLLMLFLLLTYHPLIKITPHCSKITALLKISTPRKFEMYPPVARQLQCITDSSIIVW